MTQTVRHHFLSFLSLHFCYNLNMVIKWTDVFKQEAGKRKREWDGGEEKDNPQELSLPSLLPKTSSHTLPQLHYFPIISPILSGDFHKAKQVQNKRISVPLMCHAYVTWGFSHFPNTSELPKKHSETRGSLKLGVSHDKILEMQPQMYCGIIWAYNFLSFGCVAHCELQFCDREPLNSPHLITFQRGSIWSARVHRDFLVLQ